MTATHHSSNTLAPLDGLPKPFVNAMRTLFDIMDDQRTGYVKFSEIERRWQDDGAQGMPRGVLGSLRKVTPPDGYLSFERFCAGLQISLLRNKMEDKTPNNNFGLNIPPKLSGSNTGLPPPPPPLSRPPSAPILDQEHHPKLTRTVTSIPSTSQASGSGGSHHSRAERTVSMPHLDDVVSHSEHSAHQHYHQSEFRSHSSKPDIKMGLGVMSHSKSVGNMVGPPKPPRVMERDRGTQSLDRNMENRNLGEIGRIPSDMRATHSLERERSDRKWDLERSDRPHRDRDRNDHVDYRRDRGSSLERLLDPEEKANHIPLGKAGIRSALQTWHKERRKGEVGDNNNNNKNFQEKDIRDMRVPLPAEPLGRGVGDGGDGSRTSVGNQPESHLAAALSTNIPSLAATHKKSTRKREARRHTLQNGIDYSLVRRLKQLEAERDMLVQGYEVVERARNWYRQQLQAVSERIHYLPQGPPQNEPSVEAQQEMLHFQLARIHEVNSHLRALMEASERGLPSHINLAIRPTVSSSHFSSKNAGVDPEEQVRVIERLKDQNHLLTEEVSLKSERITGLEREKAALLRELFQSRSSQQLQATSADSTFM
ncbi:suppressor APC domain-containing protein 2-like [Macrobrachium nipponense]|uniref:suppressor APC domain-containing protein 2-like n=1 Tax=Macrobrachium nipponense TaxID=159736 RepID=UPI0030C7DA36